MARVTNPLMSQDARGSVSGIQFSHNPSGQFVSRKSTGTRAQRGESTNWRSQIKLAHTAWLNLSAELQTQWNAFAPPTQTGRTAFIGAYLRNLLISEPVFTNSPLESVTAVPFVDVKAQNQPGPPPRILVDWNMRAPANDALIGYWAIPTGTSLPHVRKFKYDEHGHGFDGAMAVHVPYLPDITALRLIHWDYTRGRTVAEYRVLLVGPGWYQITPP